LPRQGSLANYFSYYEMLVNHCDQISARKSFEIMREVGDTERLLYLCDQAGTIKAVKGVTEVIDAPEKFGKLSFFEGGELTFKDDQTAFKEARLVEEYNMWFTSQTHFGMRVVNSTNHPISKIITGYKKGDCVPPSGYFYEKIMIISIPAMPAGKEWLVKWSIPSDIQMADYNCMDVIRVF